MSDATRPEQIRVRARATREYNAMRLPLGGWLVGGAPFTDEEFTELYESILPPSRPLMAKTPPERRIVMAECARHGMVPDEHRCAVFDGADEVAPDAPDARLQQIREQAKASSSGCMNDLLKMYDALQQQLAEAQRDRAIAVDTLMAVKERASVTEAARDAARKERDEARADIEAFERTDHDHTGAADVWHDLYRETLKKLARE